MGGAISCEELAYIAESFIEVLGRIDIDKSSLDKLVRQRIFEIRQTDFIQVAKFESKTGKIDYLIEYLMWPRGVPLRLKIDLQSGYSIIEAKSSSRIRGYSSGGLDKLGNTINTKTVMTTDREALIAELIRLTYKSS